jgi:hypothetical protein
MAAAVVVGAVGSAAAANWAVWTFFGDFYCFDEMREAANWRPLSLPEFHRPHPSRLKMQNHQNGRNGD